MFGNKTFLVACGISVLAAASLVLAGPEGREGPTPEQRKQFLERRLAKLPEPERALALQIVPLKDSLMRTVGDYKRKVRDGAQPRSLSAERSAIQGLQTRIWTLEAQNPDVTLDLLAHMPAPFEGGPRWRHRPPPPRGDSLSGCPRRGPGGDSLPPPPDEDED